MGQEEVFEEVNDTNGRNGRNGWKDWILAVVGMLLATGIAGLVIANTYSAQQIGALTERVNNLEVRLNEKTMLRYTSDDAKRDRQEYERRFDDLYQLLREKR